MEQQDFKKFVRGEQQGIAPAIRSTERVQSNQFNLRDFALGKGADSIVVVPNDKPARQKPVEQ